MSASLTYFPAYAGLFASLLLALACNAFLDIGYGIFGVEIVFWAAVFGWTLLVGWRQHGQADERGAGQQKVVLLIGAVLSILVFIPTWGFPRAGVYILGILQAGMNCVTTTRRQLHFGLLVSAVMVMFAAAHFRADWTMLFYLVPYIVAVVFTLVSEQISRRARDLREASLGTAWARPIPPARASPSPPRPRSSSPSPLPSTWSRHNRAGPTCSRAGGSRPTSASRTTPANSDAPAASPAAMPAGVKAGKVVPEEAGRALAAAGPTRPAPDRN